MRRESPLNNKDEKEEKIIDSLKESSIKKTFSNAKNLNSIRKNENNDDIFTGENNIFDLSQYFQEEESYLNYQDSFQHEDINCLLNANAQRKKLSNNKAFESENLPADSTVNESPNHKEKKVSIENVPKTNNFKRKRGRPRVTLDENDISIKMAFEKKQKEKKKTKLYEKNDHHILHEKELNGKEVVDQNYNKKEIAKIKNYDEYEKGNQVKNNKREKNEFKFETPKRSFKDNSSSSNDRIPFAEKYIQNFRENQNFLQKPENSSPTQNMERFQYQHLSFPPPQIMQSNNIDAQNFHRQDNLKLISNMSPQNQFFDQLNYENNIQYFPSNYLKLDQFNQTSSLGNYDSINQIQTQPNLLNNYDSIDQMQAQLNSLSNYDSVNQIQAQPNLLNNYGSVNHIQTQSNSLNNYDSINQIQAQLNSLSNYDLINQTQIQPKSLNNYDLSKQIQSNSLNNYDSFKQIQPISLSNYEPNSYPPFSDFNNEKKLTIYQNEYSDLNNTYSNSLNKDYNHNCLANLIDIQNNHQLQIEEMVLSIAVNEPSIILQAMTNSELILNPLQLNFEPQSFWKDINKDFTFGELVNKFFRSKNTHCAKFIYKLYDMLLITKKMPFYKGIIGISWVTDRIFSLDVQFFASLLNIPYLQIDSVLFGPKGNFTVLGFAEVTPQNFQQAGLRSFPNIPGQNFKLMFHVDLIFVNEQLNTQILDGIENHYQSKKHPIYNNIMVRPKYPGFSS